MEGNRFWFGLWICLLPDMGINKILEAQIGVKVAFISWVQKELLLWLGKHLATRQSSIFHENTWGIKISDWLLSWFPRMVLPTIQVINRNSQTKYLINTCMWLLSKTRTWLNWQLHLAHCKYRYSTAWYCQILKINKVAHVTLPM